MQKSLIGRHKEFWQENPTPHSQPEVSGEQTTSEKLVGHSFWHVPFLMLQMILSVSLAEHSWFAVHSLHVKSFVEHLGNKGFVQLLSSRHLSHLPATHEPWPDMAVKEQSWSLRHSMQWPRSGSHLVKLRLSEQVWLFEQFLTHCYLYSEKPELHPAQYPRLSYLLQFGRLVKLNVGKHCPLTQ